MYELSNKEFLYTIYVKIRKTIEEIESLADENIKEKIQKKDSIINVLSELIQETTNEELKNLLLSIEVDVFLNDFNSLKNFIDKSLKENK